MAIQISYIVINIQNIIQNMLDESTGDENSYRKSLDGIKAILKFKTAYPNSTAGVLKYTHTEILQFIKDNNVDWNGLI